MILIFSFFLMGSVKNFCVVVSRVLKCVVGSGCLVM